MNKALRYPPEPRSDGRSLLARPQPLGVLPTMWFWHDPGNWRLVRVPFVLVLIAATLGLIIAGAPVWAVLLGPALPFLLSLGLFERYIRRRALDEADTAQGGPSDAR